MGFKIITLFLLSISLYANCEKDSDKRISKKYSCSHDSLELVFIKDTCQRYEGSNFSSCFYVRNCNKNQIYSTFIHYEKSSIDQICDSKKAKVIILGDKYLEPKISEKAYIICEKFKPVAVKLESKKGSSKLCPLPHYKL